MREAEHAAPARRMPSASPGAVRQRRRRQGAVTRHVDVPFTRERVAATSDMPSARSGATPGFTVVAVLALAIGIGANTAIYSLVDAVFVRGLPYPDPDRLMVLIGNVRRAAGVERRGNVVSRFCRLARPGEELRRHGAFVHADNADAGGFVEIPSALRSKRVSAPYFSLLGVGDAGWPRVFRRRGSGRRPRCRRRAQRWVVAAAFWRRSGDRRPHACR